MRPTCALSLLLLTASAPALAQDAPPSPAPEAVKALAGCWRGTGAVMGKPVAIVLSARPITEGAMFLVEAESHATADPADRYAAHLIFGGRAPARKGDDAGTISGFWIDSFGGDYTATGLGTPGPGGFEITYDYPDAAFVNRWRRTADRLTWTIVSRRGAEPEAAFASYDLSRTACPGPEGQDAGSGAS